MQRVRGEVDLKRRDQTRPREGRVEAGQSVRIGNHDNKRDRQGVPCNSMVMVINVLLHSGRVIQLLPEHVLIE